MGVVEENWSAGRYLDGPDPQARREFSVYATGQATALAAVGAWKGVAKGVAYQDADGLVPDPSLVCRSLSAVCRAPAPPGALALWTVLAEYGRLEKNPAVPGGPPTFADGSQVGFEPVEIDSQGDAILNSKGELIDGVQGPIVTPSLDAEWWVPRGRVGALIAPTTDGKDPYRGRVNSAVWRVRRESGAQVAYKAKSAYCANLGEAKTEGQWTLMRATFLFKPLYESWTLLELADYTVEDGRKIPLEAGEVAAEPDILLYGLEIPTADFNALGFA